MVQVKQAESMQVRKNIRQPKPLPRIIDCLMNEDRLILLTAGVVLFLPFFNRSFAVDAAAVLM